ncbi:SDR family NAD(P)-dependent oxidoreductase [Pseudonocardia broussonetiae]|uniref:SDR family oxidoreductase n=1 Tax=Pseudonocardia broussonetiae TaxID=2736640 RepID=A0A6M6JNJ3_9PSEU|nr:SDR family oxidoreductase [Pseudonocardia broussonetiae]QJY48866.1 SDR family oxidoreductase [Pseudonocardia broussonetiae]
MSAPVRRAVVTGAARGIGLAVAERLLGDGCAVSLWDRDAEALAAAGRALGPDGGRVHTAVVDVADEAGVAAAAAGTAAAIGAPDVLVNNAAVPATRGSVLALPMADWDRALAVNLTGALLCARALVPAMRDAGWGRVVNIASIAGKEPRPLTAQYGASKAALISLTKSLGAELAASGVLVNAITPGPAETALWNVDGPEHRRRMIEENTALAPIGRLLCVEEVAELAAWLSSPACSYSAGAVFDISGGRSTY